jgi:hypothetical protein
MSARCVPCVRIDTATEILHVAQRMLVALFTRGCRSPGSCGCHPAAGELLLAVPTVQHRSGCAIGPKSGRVREECTLCQAAARSDPASRTRWRGRSLNGNAVTVQPTLPHGLPDKLPLIPQAACRTYPCGSCATTRRRNLVGTFPRTSCCHRYSSLATVAGTRYPRAIADGFALPASETPRTHACKRRRENTHDGG